MMFLTQIRSGYQNCNISSNTHTHPDVEVHSIPPDGVQLEALHGNLGLDIAIEQSRAEDGHRQEPIEA